MFMIVPLNWSAVLDGYAQDAETKETTFSMYIHFLPFLHPFTAAKVAKLFSGEHLQIMIGYLPAKRLSTDWPIFWRLMQIINDHTSECDPKPII
ncbi:hypothetical protein ACJX0J_010740, partial [Zea mays]